MHTSCGNRSFGKVRLQKLQLHIIYCFANGNTGNKRFANGETGEFQKKGEKNMPKKTEAPQEAAAESTAEKRDYSLRRWMPPNKRAKGYAEERKAKVHQRGPKEGQELSEYDKGLRSGYLLAQSDSAEFYKYQQAIDEGKSVQEAREISWRKGK